MSVKQVIVMRKDLKMRRGKEIAQGAHASSKWIVDRIDKFWFAPFFMLFSNIERAWLFGQFKKVCVRVNSEEELMDVYNKAKKAGLTVALIEDSGKTEFSGVITRTCCAIGPNDSELVDLQTGHLELY